MEIMTDEQKEHEMKRRLHNLKIFNIRLEHFKGDESPELEKLFDDYINCNINMDKFTGSLLGLLRGRYKSFA